MYLSRQVLDQQLVDRSNLNIGKVDGIVLELSDDGPPRVAAILTGGHILAWRLHPCLERLVSRLTRGWCPGDARPIRIPWSKVKKIGVDVKVDISADGGMRGGHWVG